MVSAGFGNMSSEGLRVMVNVPLVIPEEDHIVWSLVIAGNLEQLRRLMSCGKNLVHVRNQWGQSLMHVAAKIHQPAVFNYLLSIGMDEHSQDENQKTAATTVLTRRGSEEYALTLDADDLADRLGWTPLHKAAALVRQGFQLTEDVLEHEQGDINIKDVLGRTPLHWLAENGETDAIRLLTQDRCAAVLLDAGSNANARDSHQRPPLHHFDNAELLHLIVQKGADVYMTDDEGCNIMHHVAVSDQTALAIILLDWYGHTLFITNHTGDTPLALAVQNNSLGVMEALVPVLSDFPTVIRGATNRSHRNILHLAAMYGSTGMMDLLATSCLVDLNSYITTFNCGRKLIDVDYFSANLYNGLKTDLPPDLIVLCLQEIAPLGYSFLGGSLLAPYLARFTEAISLATTRKFAGNDTEKDYVSVMARNVGLTGIMVFAKHHLAHRVRWVQTGGVGVGQWFEMGNKGAVGVRLGLHSDGNIQETVFTFVSAHLAPFEKDWERRNEDWKSICEGLVFEEAGGSSRAATAVGGDGQSEREPLLSSADRSDAAGLRGIFSPPSHLVFAGDLNYRTSDKSPAPGDADTWPQPVDTDTDPRHLSHFLPKDQLTRERSKGETLHLLTEAPIDFPPTYKYSSAAQKHALASSLTTASHKMRDGRTVETTESRPPAEEVWLWAQHRTPSWCDRVLFLEAAPPKDVFAYTALPIQPTSDHRPVVLSCSISIKPVEAQLKPPFEIRKDWKQRRAAARRYELIIGLLAYLGWTWEGEALLAGTVVGVVGGYLVLRALVGSGP
ncbi:hypothetical protein B0A55_07205 [Friedmanniomyces simplex]|uniref:Inositol polyphosphate-related phosphatase domain-containing protein n=1 Tax=Friedmanniomyces simplex TaxID=329884 RepID=A0A4U0XM57_9PEZI|nr:hypothetical protein B0A55_07205 [Friedmanniomyces simplex]